MGFLSNTDPREKAINQQIQLTHNQINELYTDLGRYVKLNLKDKIDDQYVKNTAQNIDDCLARLQQLNKDLNSIRGIKLCVNCSAQIPVAVTFCPACGTKQPDNNMGMNGAMMNGGMNPAMNGGMMNGGMNPAMNGGMNPAMNGGMNPAMNGGMNNTMNGGFGGAAPVPTPIPTPAPAPFNPAGAGNSPANANKNKIGANTQQPPQPAQTAQPVMNDVPPVPPSPQANAVLNDIPPVPPVPEKAAPAPAEAEPLSETTVTNDAPVIEETSAPAEEPKAEEPKTESFVFCSQCGHKEPSDVAFCSQCGSKL